MCYMSYELFGENLLRTPLGTVKLWDKREENRFDVAERAAQKALGQTSLLTDRIIDFSRPGLGHVDLPWAAMQMLPRALDLAAEAMEKRARSYRVKVGAVMCAVATEQRRIGLFYGGNYKPYQGGPRECAEAEVLSKIKCLEAEGFTDIPFMAVHGPDEFQDIDPFPSKTLHPCGKTCRPTLRDYLGRKELFRPDTLVVTTSYGGAVEVHALAEMLDAHARQDGTDQRYSIG